MSTTSDESISGKSSDFEYKGCQLWGVVSRDGAEVWGWCRGVGRMYEQEEW
jgi:hypothetical protein